MKMCTEMVEEKKKKKQNRSNSCPVSNFVLHKPSQGRVISDKIDQNYIISFYSPLKTQPKGTLAGREQLVICRKIVTIWPD